MFGLSGSFAKALLETGWTPGAAVTARLTGAALILAVPAILALRGRWHQLRDNWVTILLFGFIGVAACQLFYFNAVATALGWGGPAPRISRSRCSSCCGSGRPAASARGP